MIFGWLKQRMPRSLYGRAALILIVPMVTLQLAISVVFIQRHYDGVTRQMTRSVLFDVELLATEWPEDPVRTTEIAERLAFTIEPAAAVPDSNNVAFYDLSGRAVAAEFRNGMTGVLAADLSERRLVELWIDTTSGPVKIGFDRRRVAASNPHQLLVLMVFVGVLMTVIAFLFLRNQLKPIKRLADASAEFGKGRMVDFKPSGANEVRAAGSAFLDMRARIDRQAQTRTMMLSGVSHDLRTPLTRLKLGLEMVDGGDVEPMRRDVAEMEAMLDGFLDFARTKAAASQVPVEIGAFVTRAVEDARRAGRPVDLVEVEHGQARVSMDAGGMRRALDNLIANAVRYGTKAVVSLRVGEKSVRIRVEDDGPGIPAEQREEAVKAFTRLDPARNQDRGSGVGLGLAIAADIARSHGGTLRLDESPTHGGLMADLVLAR